LQLRAVDAQGAASPAGSARGAPAGAGVPAGAPQTSPAGSPNAPKLAWEGQSAAKVGEAVTLYLNMDSAELLRAASLQLAFNPAELEVVAVDEGAYFSKNGKGSFSKSVDAAGGRVSVGTGVTEGDGAKGRGRLLAVTVKARAPVNGINSVNVGVISMTPIGGALAIGRPGLPVLHTLTIAP
jgi:general secretion pathway protein D